MLATVGALAFQNPIHLLGRLAPFLFSALLLCGFVSAQPGTVHFETTYQGNPSHSYTFDNFGTGGANNSGTGTLDGTTSITWSTDGEGNLTVKLNGGTIARFVDGGNVEEGIGVEGDKNVFWVNLDYSD